MVCWSDPSWMRMAFVGVSWHFHPRRFSKSGLVGFGGALVVDNGHGMEVGFCLHLYHLYHLVGANEDRPRTIYINL